MTVNQLATKYAFSVVTMPEGEKIVSGCYVGDLLSWVMGRAKAGNVWVTIMSNLNVVAVASLVDVSCVILAEGVTLDKEIVDMAMEKGVNILSSSKTAFETLKDIASEL